MSNIVTFYSIASTVLAFASIGFVIVDSLLNKERKATVAATVEAAVETITVMETAKAAEQIPLPVEEIDAVQADAAISDALAISSVRYERGAGRGTRYFVNIGDIDRVFSSGDTVTISDLKAAGLLSRKAQRVKILADGILHKSLTVKADAFSVQAIKMIELTGGTVVILRD